MLLSWLKQSIKYTVFSVYRLALIQSVTVKIEFETLCSSIFMCVDIYKKIIIKINLFLYISSYQQGCKINRGPCMRAPIYLKTKTKLLLLCISSKNNMMMKKNRFYPLANIYGYFTIDHILYSSGFAQCLSI